MILRFHGHACFELEAGDGTRLCIDPYEAGGFDGAVRLAPLPDHFDAWVATHDHADHCAGHTIPSARRVRPPTVSGPFGLETRRAAHDEFGGRLRGGFVDMIRVEAEGAVVVHLGDLGERLVGAPLAWLRDRPVDALIVPVGGYYTLGPDGAAELAGLVQPRYVVPCHAAEDGVALPELGSRELFVRRFDEPLEAPELELGASVDPPHAPTRVLLLERRG